MTKKNMMKQAHKLAKQIVEEVGDYTIALSLAMKKVWEMVKEGRKKMTASAFKNAVYTLTHKVYNGPKFLWIGQQGVPEWLLYENLDVQERCAVDGAYRMYAKRETEKAVLIEFDTKFGYITMWAPKSVVKGF